jgi:hypothetical protein
MKQRQIIPSYLLSTNHFAEIWVSLNELRAKKWTETMIKLVGKPVRYVEKSGTPMFLKSRIDEVMQMPQFKTELVKVLGNRLSLHKGALPVDEYTLAEGCEVLYHLNKHAKAKKFTASDVKMIYTLKSFFIRYMYENGHVNELVFETDTNLYRFTILIGGKKYTWHQPMEVMMYAVNCPHVISDGIDETPTEPTDHIEVLNRFERVVLSLNMNDLQLGKY